MPVLKCWKCRHDKKGCVPSDQSSSKCKRCETSKYPCSDFRPPHEHSRVAAICLEPQEAVGLQYSPATSMAPTIPLCCPPHTNTSREFGVEGTSGSSTVYGPPVGFNPHNQGVVAGIQCPSHTPAFAGGDMFHEEQDLLPLYCPPGLAGESNPPEYTGSRQHTNIPLNSVVPNDADVGDKVVADDVCFEKPSSGDKV